MATAKRFWLSWCQPTDDYRPLTDLPHPQILGWWCSGFDASGQATLCACVDGKSEADARTQVRLSWPEAIDWRFAEERDADWKPGVIEVSLLKTKLTKNGAVEVFDIDCRYGVCRMIGSFGTGKGGSLSISTLPPLTK